MSRGPVTKSQPGRAPAQQILKVRRKVHTCEHVASAVFYLGVPMADIPRARLFAAMEADQQPPEERDETHEMPAKNREETPGSPGAS